MPIPSPRRRLTTTFFHLAAAFGLALSPASASAADPKPAATALDKVPANVEFYSASLRLGETAGIVGRSNAWKQIWDEPAVQGLWKKARQAYEADGGDWAAVRKFFADPANENIPALAADAISNELFVYVGSGTGDLFSLVQEMAGGARLGTAFQKLMGAGDADPTRARVRMLLQMLSEKPERIRIPDVVIGFKVSDQAKVAAQLKRLDPLVADALGKTPLKGLSGRVKVGGDDFLVLKLDGSLVPWDMLPLGQFEEKEGEFAKLFAHLKKMKLSVAVGVRQGYLLVAVTESPDRLTAFGGAGPKLAGRPELKPLAKFADKPLLGVGYTSAALRSAVATTPEDIAGGLETVKGLLQMAGLDDDERQAIEKDLESLAKAIARGLKKPGAATSFSFRTPRGWESYAYDYSEAGTAEARPLTLLNHLGGSPLLAAVWRSGTTVEDYRSFAKWLALFAGHAEKVVAAKVPGAEAGIQIYRTEVVPLLKEVGAITEKLWLPALADGQEAVVLDAKWSSKRWHAMMPESDRALPMLELGVVLGVSDSAKLRKALAGYLEVANKAIARARELAPPGSIPDFEIPKPRVEEADGRILANYPIPAEWGIDGQFQPTGGLSSKVAVLSLSRGHGQRLMTETPLKSGSAPLADLKRPLDSAFYLNWEGMVDAAAPWVRYAIRSGAAAGNEEMAGDVARKAIRILKVFQSYSAASYREGGATITHGEAIFRDIGPEGEK